MSIRYMSTHGMPDIGNRATRRTFLTAVGTGTAVTLAGCSGGDDFDEGGADEDPEDFPSQSIELINTYSEGGGTDINIRQLQPHFDEELGVNTQIDYQAGAGTRIGTNIVAEAPPDGYTLGLSRSPAFEMTFLIDEEDKEYEVDDIYPIGSMMTEATVIRARGDEDRFEDIEDLIAYAESNPGELTCGVSGVTNRHMLSMALLMEATDVEFTMVPFDGGGETQTSLLQGEIDIICRSVYNSADIDDQTDVLAIYADENEWPDLTNDAPPINEALEINIPYEPTEGRQFEFGPGDLPEQNPEQFDYLVDAYENAVMSDGFRSDLEEVGEEDKISYMSPEEMWNHIDGNLDYMEEYADIMLGYAEEGT